MTHRWIAMVSLLAQLVVLAHAEAQTTTLYYESNAMTGTSDYLAASASTLTSAPVIGSISGSIVLTGSIGAGNLDLRYYDFSFIGNNGSPVSLSDVVQTSPGIISSGTGQFFGLGTNFSLITSNGAITGVTGSFTDGPYGGITLLTLEPSGDFFQWSFGSNTLGGCENIAMNHYAGFGINPCDLSVSSDAAGVWTVQTSPVPLPATIVLMFSGIAGLAAFARMRPAA